MIASINASKGINNNFPSYFEYLWQCCDSNQDINKESTRAGVEELKELLDKLYDNNMNAGRKITATHTKSFITSVNRLIQKIDSANNSAH